MSDIRASKFDQVLLAPDITISSHYFWLSPLSLFRVYSLPRHFERSEKSVFSMSDIRASKFDQVLLAPDITISSHYFWLSPLSLFRVYSLPRHFERSEKSVFSMSDIRASKFDQVLLAPDITIPSHYFWLSPPSLFRVYPFPVISSAVRNLLCPISELRSPIKSCQAPHITIPSHYFWLSPLSRFRVYSLLPGELLPVNMSHTWYTANG